MGFIYLFNDNVMLILEQLLTTVSSINIVTAYYTLIRQTTYREERKTFIFQVFTKIYTKKKKTASLVFTILNAAH